MKEPNGFDRILVVGGAGYVGSALIPLLLDKGFQVRVADLFLYGKDVFDSVRGDPGLDLREGDVRDLPFMREALKGCDAVIHLACISNDPSFELDPALGRAINYECFEPFVLAAKEAGVRRFIYASSSSVYGVSESPNVTEEHELKPLTDYSKFKAMCEKVLLKHLGGKFNGMVLRPATVCGWAPRLRLDLAVNILTSHAVNKRKITVLGGKQLRPNIHIQDIAELYVLLLGYPEEKIAGKTFNAGFQNRTVSDIAQIVRGVVSAELPQGGPIEIVTAPSNDNRSYHISAEKIRRELGYAPRHTIEDAVRELTRAFKDGRIPDPDDIRYYNIKKMQAVGLK